jgi:formylglycine-generating enzyme required for sulfatase activity
MKRFAFIVLNLLLIVGAVPCQDVRGLQKIRVANEQGKEVDLYKGSYALLICVSDYTGGWPALPGVKKDLTRVNAALVKSGFTVSTVLDPDSNQLRNAYSDFINKYGQDVENRLLFYFAGHGHTLKQSYGEEMGYIVPRDAPSPNKDLGGFIAKALDMQMMEVFAKRIQSKHALFLFDSCFSGSLFAISRAIPESISYRTSRPVRQFITSGSADEYVADDSVFCAQFVEALDGDGDLDRDGYVTGTELGLYLQDKVINYSRNAQHPQYGKIRNPNLDKGDFVFVVSAPEQRKETPPVREAAAEKPPEKAPDAVKAEPPAQEEKTEPAYQNTVVITTEPPAARILVDGAAKGTGTLTLHDLPFGEHVITASSAGYRDSVEKLTVTRYKKEFTLLITLKQKRPTIAGPGGMEMVRLPAGAYAMGSIRGESDEQPVHEVTLTRALLIGQMEVSNEQFCRVMNWGIARGYASLAGGDLKGVADGKAYLGIGSLKEQQFGIQTNGREISPIPGREQHPVVGVSWFGAAAFCNFLSESAGLERMYDLASGACDWRKKGYRLPTEAEWEYAACGTDVRAYPWGNVIDAPYANYFGSNDPYESATPPYSGNGGPTTPGGFYDGSLRGAFATMDNASPFGAYDLLGNVYEWCGDWAGRYEAKAQVDPKGPSSGTKRVYRGGSWISGETLLYSTHRFSDFYPTECIYTMGFRVALAE